MKDTWILIANSSEARLFKTEKHSRNMKLVKEFFHNESREKVENLITDAAGRYRQSTSSPKSAFEDANSPKEIEADKFAHILAQILDEGRNHNLYENLVFIAPSHFQGLLNKNCNHYVMGKVVKTLDKDYTKVREYDLPKYLNGKLSRRFAA